MSHPSKVLTGALCASLLLALSACGETITTSTTSTDLGPVTLVQVEPTNRQLEAETKLQLAAVAIHGSGTSEIVTSDASWVSGAPSVCTVTAKGVATGVAKGECEVTASYAGLTATTRIYVTPPFSTLQVFVQKSGPVGIPRAAQAIAIYTDNSWSDVTADEKVQWMAEDSRIVAVTRGQAVGLKADSTTHVTAMYRGVVASAEFKVTKATVASIKFTPATVSLVQTTNAQVALKATMSDASIEDITGFATLTPSDAKMLSIDGGGVISSSATKVAVAATIDASFQQSDASAEKTASLAVDVLPDSVVASAMSFVKDGKDVADMTLIAGRPEGVAVIATFSDGSTEDVSDIATWSSADRPTVLVASPGRLLGLKAGATSVSVGFGKLEKLKLLVNVVDAKLQTIAVAASATAISYTGTPATLVGNAPVLTATGHFTGKAQNGTAFARDVEITGEVTWLSDNEDALVIGNGIYAGETYPKPVVGTISVTAWLGTIQALPTQFTVAVTP